VFFVCSGWQSPTRKGNVTFVIYIVTKEEEEGLIKQGNVQNVTNVQSETDMRPPKFFTSTV
jgi:hypothetical protein